MSFEVLHTQQFKKDFKKLDNFSQDRIRNKVKEIALNPERYKHMKYDFSGSCRIRVGKLRVIFSYDVGKQIIYLEKIVFGHKY